MSVADEISRIKGNIASAYTAAGGKGATMPSVQNSANLAGCIDTITGGGGEVVDKTKFGVSIDNILGDVDADGTLTPANAGDFVLDLTGVKAIYSVRMFDSMFANRQNLKAVYAPDLKELSSYLFYKAFYFSYADTAVFGIETIRDSWSDVFEYAFAGSGRVRDIRFLELKSIHAYYGLSSICEGCTVDTSTMFPKLEEISGTKALGDFCKDLVDNTALFPKVKKITGGTSAYSATFYTYSGYKTAVFKFPEATEFTGYIFSSTFAGEIHFAVANQSAIEACDGYDKKWGATNASIIFDL